MTTPIPNAADMADKPIDYLLMCGRSENPKPPSAIDVIKMFREIHEEHRDDASARGVISSKAAMAFVEHCESLEEQNRNMRKALEEIAQGVDHPDGYTKQQEFYQAVSWAVTIAREALFPLRQRSALELEPKLTKLLENYTDCNLCKGTGKLHKDMEAISLNLKACETPTP